MTYPRLFALALVFLLVCTKPAVQAEQAPPFQLPDNFLERWAERMRFENRPFTNGDFEQGLDGWEATGDAFEAQPTFGHTVTPERTRRVTLAGDYWRSALVRVGHSGSHWIGTYERRPGAAQAVGTVQGDGPTGTLTSGLFDLDEAHRYVSFLVGGGSQDVGVQFQILGRTPADADTIVAAVARSADTSPSNIERVGQWVVVQEYAGTNAEPMRQIVIEVPAEWRGRGFRGRISIVDNASGGWGHINVDDVRVGPRPPPPRGTPLWGFADLHTHPMAHMGFGGLRGLHPIWGLPGGRFADYAADPRRIERDLPACDGFAHGSGTLIAGFVIAGIEGRIPADSGMGDALAALGPFFNFELVSHARAGPPTVPQWPDFRAGAHQQMHVTQIRRAYDGGLRLMSALVVNSEILEYSLSSVGGGEARASKSIAITPTLEVLQAQVCGMRRLADLNRDWMEIAYSPEDARRIVGQNKLAVVLGTELPQLGTLGRATAEAEVQFLYELGIRQVTLVHAADNRLGGAAIAQDAYNTLNDYLHRPLGQRDVDGERFRAGTHPPLTFFGVREGGCGNGSLRGQRGECVLYRLKSNPEALTYDFHFLIGFHPGREATATRSDYVGTQGHMNVRALTPYGADYVRALMARGMLIDLSHMSDLTVLGVIDLSRRWISLRYPGCGVSGLAALARAPEECFTDAYPLMVSHVAFRAQSVRRDGSDEGATAGTTVRGFLPREFELSDLQAEFVRRGGGVIGVFVGQDPIENPPGWTPPAVANDCAGSASGFAHAYAYGLHRMGGRGVAIATDFGLHPMLNPRFGPNACWIFNMARDPGREIERMPDQYRRSDQRAGVVYVGNLDGPVWPPSPRIVRMGSNAPLQPYRLGTRTYSVNLDGLAHYGMIPDVLQDARNLGLDDARLDPLFRSAEDYVAMWEKAIRVGGASPRRFVPAALDCTAACRGLCPR